MPQDYGAAQPIADWTDRYVGGPVRAVLRTVGMLPDPPRSVMGRGPVDPSWHAEMVRQANRSMQQRADQDRAAAAAQPVKRAPRRVNPRTPPRPSAGKRR